MTPAFDKYAMLMDYEKTKGRFAKLTSAAQNAYNLSENMEIPENSILCLGFCCDSGLYAIADIGGVLHHVKIGLSELNKVELMP